MQVVSTNYFLSLAFLANVLVTFTFYQCPTLGANKRRCLSTHWSHSGSASHPGWHINVNCGKKVCCVSQHSVQNMEEILRNRPGDVEEGIGGLQPSSEITTSFYARWYGRNTTRAQENEPQQGTRACQFWSSLPYANPTPRCRAVITGSTCGCWALKPSL